MVPPDPDSLSVKEWAAIITASVGAVLLGIKQALRMRSDWRADQAEGSAESVAARTIAALTKQNDRQESVIANLSEQLQRRDDRLTVEMEARRKAVHEALDAAQSVLAAKHQLEVAQAAADALRTRIAELELEIAGLKLSRPVAGDMP